MYILKSLTHTSDQKLPFGSFKFDFERGTYTQQEVKRRCGPAIHRRTGLVFVELFNASSFRGMSQAVRVKPIGRVSV